MTHRTPHSHRLAALLLAIAFLPGCEGMRLVIDAVPAVDDITETTVLDDGGRRRGGSKIAMIDVRGLIADESREGVLGSSENPIARFTESLHRAERDAKVRAVLVRINSPGGTVTSSDIMYRELLGFRERSSKPVIVLMGDVAASGGFYLACAADEIIAHPTTVTGSIGVIMQTVNFSEGMQRIGIRADAITSGPNKAAGSPLEPMSPEHRALLQGMVNEFFESFRTVVLERRTAVPEADLSWVTDGRVVTGRRAAEIGLVDATGDLRDAFEAAKRRAGVRQARLVKYHRPLEHVASPYARAPAPPADASVLRLEIGPGRAEGGAGFWYLWDPTVW